MDYRKKILTLFRRGENREAINFTKDWIRKNPSIINYSFVASQIKKNSNLSLKSLKIALLSSFTLQTIKNFIEVEAFLNEFSADTYFCNFNQWRQDLSIVDSNLDKFNPEIIILIVNLEDLSPKLYKQFFLLKKKQIEEEIDISIQEIVKNIKNFRLRSNTPIIVSDFIIPSLSISSVFDWTIDIGLQRTLFKMNERLASEIKNIPNVAILNYNDLASRFGKDRWSDSELFYSVRNPIILTAMPILAKEIFKFINSFLKPHIKCIVTDLDNTLWGGIIGEDGISGIKLGQEYPGNEYMAFQEFLLQMRSLGIILAINSHNNLNDAIEVFNKHPNCVLKISDFTSYKINWENKDINLFEIAKEINIGLDSMIFIDDNIAECELIRRSFPKVKVIHLKGSPANFPKLILDEGNYFSNKLTDEDKRRADIYKFENKVCQEYSSTKYFEEFIKNLEIEISFEKANSNSILRITQLTQRTNQFNLTTKRYSESEINQICRYKNKNIFCIKLKDKFGYYGIVGVIIINSKNKCCIISDFLMSCRIIGRKIEDIAISFIKNFAYKSGANKLIGIYIPSKKNSLVKDLYKNRNFTFLYKKKNKEYWVANLVQIENYPQDINVIEKINI